MKSPFVFGNTVSNQAFTNREEVLEKLKGNLLGGVNTILISPRRWGKSSLVEKAIAEISVEHKDVKTVIIDLFGVTSENEFLELFAKKVIQASSSNWQEWITGAKDFFKQLVPKISLGIDPTNEFSIAFDWDELQKHPEEILDLPEKIAQKNGLSIIICLDEFQNLAEFSNYEAFEKKLRAIWQRQKQVTYCLFGSKKHMLSEIFNSPAKPFYRFGDIIFLQKIKAEKWVEFITNSFNRTGKSISNQIAEEIAECMKCHSWYVQQLSHYVWQQSGNVVLQENLETARNELLSANLPFYQKQVMVISKTQLNLLKAIASGETQYTSALVMRNFQLGTSRNVAKNKEALEKHELVFSTEKELEFLDPAFEMWFKKQFKIS